MTEQRLLTADDAAEYQALRLESLANAPSAFGSSAEEEEARVLDQVRPRIVPDRAHEGQFVLGRFEDGVLFGVCGLWRQDRIKERHKASVWGMYVRPAARRGGHGRALLAETLERARAVPGLRQVHLGVEAENAAARGLYEQAGFRLWGVEPASLRVDEREYDVAHYVLSVDG